MKFRFLFILIITSIYSITAQKLYQKRYGYLKYKLYDKNDTINKLEIDYYFKDFGKMGILKIKNLKDSLSNKEYLIKDTFIYIKRNDSFYLDGKFSNILEPIFKSIGVDKKILYYEKLKTRKSEIKFRKFRKYKYFKNISLCNNCIGNIFYIYKNIPISINYFMFEHNGKKISLRCNYFKLKKNKKYETVLKSAFNCVSKGNG